MKIGGGQYDVSTYRQYIKWRGINGDTDERECTESFSTAGSYEYCLFDDLIRQSDTIYNKSIVS